MKLQIPKVGEYWRSHLIKELYKGFVTTEIKTIGYDGNYIYRNQTSQLYYAFLYGLKK